MTKLLSEQTTGVFIIAATPFADNGDLDLESIDRLVDFYVDLEVAGITVLGMMGEAGKMSAEESVTVLARFAARIDGRVCLVAGVSNAGIDNMRRLSRTAMELGAGGVMVAPMQGLATEARLFSYFEQVVGALGDDVPMCYQDYPQATGVSISPENFLRMVDAFETLVMLKHEECPGLAKLSAVREMSRRDRLRRISILTGNGGLYLPQELARGADGAMTGFAYPEMLVEVVDLHKQGLADAAEDLFDIYLPLVRHEQQPGFGLAARKEILRRRGALQSAKTRAPGPSLSAEDHDELSRLMARLEARLAARG